MNASEIVEIAAHNRKSYPTIHIQHPRNPGVNYVAVAQVLVKWEDGNWYEAVAYCPLGRPDLIYTRRVDNFQKFTRAN